MSGESSVLVLGEDKPNLKMDVEPVDSFRAEIEYFADCIIQDTQPLMSGREARRDLELVMAAYRSAKTGETVRV